jgi:DNA-binding response OmpR family regulator
VAEDDESLGTALVEGLRRQGYVVDFVPDGRAALSYARCFEYSVAMVGLRMPLMSGIEVVHRLRRRGIQAPVLMLSDRNVPAERVAGLDAGADDFLVKPFDFGELLARLRALQRRTPAAKPPVLTVGDVSYDPAAHEVRFGTSSPALTTTELRILEVLMRQSPSPCARTVIAQHVWDDYADPLGSNTIDVHVARLRAKISGASARIETVRGVGYRILTRERAPGHATQSARNLTAVH